MTTLTKAPFEIRKNGEVYMYDEDGMDLWNQYKSEDLPPPDEVDLEFDALSGEVSVIEYNYQDPSDILLDEMDSASGQRPPGYRSYPDTGEVQMPDYLSAVTNANLDEDMERYKKTLAKALTSRREEEIQKGVIYRYKALYELLQKGWDTDKRISFIVAETKFLMKAYPNDPKFLEAASQVLLSFDPTLPRTRIVKCIRKQFSTKEYEDMVKAGIISKADAENAIEFSKIREEARLMSEASPTSDFTVSPRTAARFPELREDVERRCEVCRQDEDGKLLRCERCSMTNKMTFPKVDDQ